MSAQQVIFQYLSAGSNTLTVPDGFSSQVLVYAWGAGGADSRAGVAGGGGGFVQGIVTVSSGDTVIISVGSTGSSNGIGGDGSDPVISLSGGSSGTGAGGGAATAVLVNGVPIIVAAGGGGAGGGSVGLAGGVATLTSSTPRGGISPDGGGGGGAGYPFGGAGGTSEGGGAGGYGGQNYANASVTSSTLTAGSGITPGGLTNALYPRAKRGYAGYDGAVIVIFTKNFRAWIKDTTWKEANNAWIKANGVWKLITQAWIKDNDEWKSIQSGVSLVPTPSTAEVITINLNIAANANNYVLSDFLSGTSYYPGRSIVNLTVDAGVIVGSGTVGTPALIVDGLVSGDLINLTNNGNIAGAGGLGGAAGSYSQVTSGGSYTAPTKGSSGFFGSGKGSYSAGTTSITSVSGRPGEIGGPALSVSYATNLINNGTIAGGGGGGGGGGGPTGGSGGGGAGRKAGSGANNGTLTAGGAGTGLGGAGGARGTAGSAGTNDTNTGGLGGAPGAAIIGIDKVTITTAGTILGERRV